MPEVTTTTGHYYPGSIQIAEFRILEILALGQELEIYNEKKGLSRFIKLHKVLSIDQSCSYAMLEL